MHRRRGRCPLGACDSRAGACRRFSGRLRPRCRPRTRRSSTRARAITTTRAPASTIPRAARHDRHRAPRRCSTGAPDARHSTSPAARAPTCARWPRTSAQALAAARTSRRCAAPATGGFGGRAAVTLDALEGAGPDAAARRVLLPADALLAATAAGLRLAAAGRRAVSRAGRRRTGAADGRTRGRAGCLRAYERCPGLADVERPGRAPRRR